MLTVVVGTCPCWLTNEEDSRVALEVNGQVHRCREGSPADDREETAPAIDTVTADEVMNERAIEQIVPPTIEPDIQNKAIHRFLLNQGEDAVEKGFESLIGIISHEIVGDVKCAVVRQVLVPVRFWLPKPERLGFGNEGVRICRCPIR